MNEIMSAATPAATTLLVPITPAPPPFLPTSGAVVGEYVDRGLLTFVAIQESDDHPGYYRVAVLAIPESTLGINGHGGGYWNQFKKPVRADGIESFVRYAIANPAGWDRIVWEHRPNEDLGAVFAPDDWTENAWKIEDRLADKNRAEQQKWHEESLQRRAEAEKQRSRKRGRRQPRLPL